MNAVEVLVRALPPGAVVRVLRAQTPDPRARAALADAPTHALCTQLADRFARDLAGLLNRLRRAELDDLAARCRVQVDRGDGIGVVRARLWLWGAEREAGDRRYLGTALQPAPIVLRGKLVAQGPIAGTAPAAVALPRPRPDPAPPPARATDAADRDGRDEPETLEALLARADALIGAPLPSTRNADTVRSDKGRFGVAVAALLGVPERGAPEPDWRGEVEIKTVPVVRDRSGWWRVTEDPCVGMERVPPLSKLERVLWIARIADAPRPTVLSWYYQELDARLRLLARRHLHTRPKGGRGARTRGWYLHKRFFAESGFLRSLNG